MRILHYFLGFPPYRTGGLTKYAFDLMQAQLSQQHTVMALWPGQMNMFYKKTKIKKRDSIKGIENYELINPLPVSLDEGISDFEEYMKECKSFSYIEFLKKSKPDAVHVHTLMGLHKEFLDATTNLKIRTVFTTHDYFGLCPKVTLYRDGVSCENDHDCRDCIQCNCSALSMNKIKIMQSPLYRRMKNFNFTKQLRKRHRNRFFTEEVIPPLLVPDAQLPSLAENYARLRSYYMEMLSSIDMIHFNSTVTESVYCRYFTPKASKVLTITHQHIADNRKVNKWKPEKILRLTCLAPARPYKGFNILKNVLDKLWNSGKKDFQLNLFCSIQEPSPYMNVNEEGFRYSELGAIMANTDVLVAPSIWYETFGFTVLEAISYGVPVIVSNHVGAQDIVGEGGIIVKAGSEKSLEEAILSLTPEKVTELRANIQTKAKIKTWQQFLTENNSLYNV